MTDVKDNISVKYTINLPVLEIKKEIEARPENNVLVDDYVVDEEETGNVAP